MALQTLKKRSLNFWLLFLLATFTYPFAWVPRGWTGHRFDWAFPWPGFLAALLVLFLLLRRGGGFGLSCSVSRTFQALTAAVCVGIALAVVQGGWAAAAAFLILYLPLLLLFFAGGCWFPLVSLEGFALAAPLVLGLGLFELSREGEWVGTFGNRNFFAVYLGITALIAGHRAFTLLKGNTGSLSRRDRRWIFWAVLGLAALAGMLRSYSRGAWIALAVGVIWLGLIPRCSIRWKRVIVALAMLTALGATWLLRTPSGAMAFPATQDVRPWIWEGAWSMLLDRPLWGVGPDRFVDYWPKHRPVEYLQLSKAASTSPHAHHWTLHILSEWGVFVGMFWILAFYWALAAKKEDPDRMGKRALLEAVLVVLLVQNWVGVSLFMPPFQSFGWWLAGSLALGRWKPSKSLASRQGLGSPRNYKFAAAGLGLFLFVMAVVLPGYGRWWTRKGLLAHDAGNWSEAEKAFTRAAAETRCDRVALLLLGSARVRQSDWMGALEAYTALSGFSPYYAGLQANLTRVWLALGEPEQALVHARRQLKVDPADADHWARLASCYLELGRFQKGANFLQKALQLDPDHPYATAMLERLEAEGKI